MSERVAAWALAVLFAGCSGGGELCPPELAAADGGFFAEAPPLPEWGLVGKPQAITLFAPVRTCGLDVKATARLRDPENVEVPVTSTSVPRRDAIVGGVRATVEFTPTRPGPWYLEVSFEPSFGTASYLLQVVSDGSAQPFTRVPASCPAPRAIADDAVLCEWMNGAIALHHEDGGVITYTGRDLVVAGDVAWFVANGRLERRQYRDGGLELTHSWLGFSETPTPALGTANLALRYRLDGGLGWIQLTDAGIVDRTLNQPPLPVAYFFTAEDADSVRQWTLSSDPPLLAIDPALAWVRGAGGIEGLRRPLRSGTSSMFLVTDPEGLLPSLPSHGVERLPLFIRPSSDGLRQLLVESDGGALVFTAWPRRGTLQVGQRHVVIFEEDGQWVRVYRK